MRIDDLQRKLLVAVADGDQARTDKLIREIKRHGSVPITTCLPEGASETLKAIRYLLQRTS